MTVRGFPSEEFVARLARVRELLGQHEIDGLLLTTEPEIRWFSGFLTRFWESPSRPWFVIVPASGKPVAVIPSIGRDLMEKSAITDIRTWQSPDLKDDGVSLLAASLADVVGTHARVGVPSGHETHLRMPLDDFARLKTACPAMHFTGDHDIMRRLRMVKSRAEIAKIEQACAIAGRTFARVPEFAAKGADLDAIFRRFQMVALEEGADWVSYVAGGAGPDGYGDVISPATPVPLREGDILMLDTGIVHDGYFCDFDRNWSVGTPSQCSKDAHARLIDAVDAAAAIAKPGTTAAELFHAMNTIVTKDSETSDAGRLGHGLGMQLTEWPSLIPADLTVLEENMVLTLEPGIATRDGRIMVHEEDIAITNTGCRFLSPRAGRDLPEI